MNTTVNRTTGNLLSCVEEPTLHHKGRSTLFGILAHSISDLLGDIYLVKKLAEDTQRDWRKHNEKNPYSKPSSMLDLLYATEGVLELVEKIKLSCLEDGSESDSIKSTCLEQKKFLREVFDLDCPEPADPKTVISAVDSRIKWVDGETRTADLILLSDILQRVKRDFEKLARSSDDCLRGGPSSNDTSVIDEILSRPPSEDQIEKIKAFSNRVDELSTKNSGNDSGRLYSVLSWNLKDILQNHEEIEQLMKNQPIPIKTSMEERERNPWMYKPICFQEVFDGITDLIKRIRVSADDLKSNPRNIFLRTQLQDAMGLLDKSVEQHASKLADLQKLDELKSKTEIWRETLEFVQPECDHGIRVLLLKVADRLEELLAAAKEFFEISLKQDELTSRLSKMTGLANKQHKLVADLFELFSYSPAFTRALSNVPSKGTFEVVIEALEKMGSQSFNSPEPANFWGRLFFKGK